MNIQVILFKMAQGTPLPCQAHEPVDALAPKVASVSAGMALAA